MDCAQPELAGHSEAELRQAETSRRLEAADADVAAGRVHVADEAYFETLREHVRNVAGKG